MRSSGSLVLREFGGRAAAEATKNCARLVSNAFRAALRHRHVDQNPFDTDQHAFDMAVCTYRKRNPGVTEKEARRAVAAIICRSL